MQDEFDYDREQDHDDYNYDYDDDYNYELQLELARRKEERLRQLKKDRAQAMAVMIVGGILLLMLIVHLISGAVRGNDDEKETVIKNNSSSRSAGDSKKPTAAEPIEFAGLYMVDSYTGYYLVDEDGTAKFDYTDGTLGGLFTGRRSPHYDGMIEIDCLDGVVLVDSSSAIRIENAVALPLGAQSQFTYYGTGESACAAACLYMIMGGDYTDVMNAAEAYADQGSLTSYTGGMTYDAMASFAKDYYGVDLVNAYSSDPSKTLRSIIDGGSQAIALVKITPGGNITESGDITHFIVITGYIDSEEGTQFIYANSYDKTGGAISLEHIDSELLANVISSDFSEPNTIAYIEKD